MKTTTIMRSVKCLAVLMMLLALGCHHPLKEQHGHADRDNSKAKADDLAWLLDDPVSHLPFVVSGSSTVIDGTRFVKIFAFGAKVEEMLTFLRSRGISPEIDSAGHAKLYDSMKLRTVVAEYLGILNRRMNVIAENLANVHTVEYRSKVLIVHEDGNTSIEPRRSSPLEYSPKDPLAIKDGPNKGYVRETDVDVVGEKIDFLIARRVYRLGQEVLRELYNDPRCKCCPEKTSTLQES